MRLINAHSLRLEEFWDQRVEKYAILSHRWEDGEVSFQDMQKPAMASTMKGFAKIQKSCERAVIDGCQYVWVDTCCINKDSSSELSEAVNSMYRWYKASAVCYAYLSDVDANSLNDDRAEQQIKSSIWFTRGWTLQELLAPQHIVFYDHKWHFLGTKQTLSKVLTLRTGIDEAILNGEPLLRRSIAQRMSWASQRETTRIEDTAYCLLGIFDVNMPMLYGEGGKKAFLRLQEEIIKQSDDHTIFAWPIHRQSQPGLLADSPAAFVNCRNIRATTSRKGRSPYSLTNRGLSIKLMATQFKRDTYLVRLECVDTLLSGDDGSVRLGMFLRRLNEDDQYVRVEHEGQTFQLCTAAPWKGGDHGPFRGIVFYVRQSFGEFKDDNKERVNGFRFNAPELGSGFGLAKISASCWNLYEGILSMKAGGFGTVGSLVFKHHRKHHPEIELIALGFDFDYNPVCFMATRRGIFNLDGFPPLSAGMKGWLADRGRIPFDTTLWSEVRDGGAVELEGHPGLWAVKGDRVNGLDVRIVARSALATLRITHGEFQDKLVWDVYLEKLAFSGGYGGVIKKFAQNFPYN